MPNRTPQQRIEDLVEDIGDELQEEMQQVIRPVDTERLDAFVDGSFAFAVTLLIIAGAEPLNDFGDLVQAVGRVPAFAAGFLLIVMFWLGHRNYGKLAPIRDAWSATLSLAIVFLVLINVFPLRLLTEAGLAYFSGWRLPGRETIDSLANLSKVYIIYGVSFSALGVCFALLYGHALRRGPALGLLPEERQEAWEWRGMWWVITAAGAGSSLLAMTLDLHRYPGVPGFFYWLIPVGIFFVNFASQKRKRRRRKSPPSNTGPTAAS